MNRKSILKTPAVQSLIASLLCIVLAVFFAFLK